MNEYRPKPWVSTVIYYYYYRITALIRYPSLAINYVGHTVRMHNHFQNKNTAFACISSSHQATPQVAAQHLRHGVRREHAVECRAKQAFAYLESLVVGPGGQDSLDLFVASHQSLRLGHTRPAITRSHSCKALLKGGLPLMQLSLQA